MADHPNTSHNTHENRGKSAFLKLLDENKVSPDDPLRTASEQMLAGGDPNELLAAAIARSQRKLQMQKQDIVPIVEGPNAASVIFERLKNSLQPSRERVDLDADLTRRIER